VAVDRHALAVGANGRPDHQPLAVEGQSIGPGVAQLVDQIVQIQDAKGAGDDHFYPRSRDLDQAVHNAKLVDLVHQGLEGHTPSLDVLKVGQLRLQRLDLPSEARVAFDQVGDDNVPLSSGCRLPQQALGADLHGQHHAQGQAEERDQQGGKPAGTRHRLTLPAWRTGPKSRRCSQAPSGWRPL